MPSEVSTAFAAGLATIQTSIQGMIGDALPVIMAIVGTVIAVTFGVRFVRKLAH